MRKKNGYTLVEVIVSMVLIVIVMLYLLRTIVVLTNKNNDLLVYEEYTVYTNSLLSSVYKDIDIAYESDNFLGIENYQAQNKILFKDVNKELSFNKSNKSIIYDGVIYQLPDNVEFREVDGKIYDATFGKNTHSYYIIRIFVKVNNRNDEEIKIVYQNKKDEDVEITYDANLTTYGAESGETATFTPSDGNVQTGKFGDKLKLPSVSYDNWTFYGWYTDKKGGKKISNDNIIEESATYYAHWEPTIEYVMNGGYQGTKCADENGTCSFSGTKLVCYGAKNKFICKVLTNSMTCNNTTFTDPIGGYAKSCYISSNPIKYADGVNVTLSNPSKLGYTFTGWTGSNGNIPETSVTIPANQTNNLKYTANYSLSTYTISYTLNGGSVATANPTSYNVNTAQFTLRNPTKSTYTFAGWTGSNGTTKQTTVTIPQYSTGNKSYTANWTCPSGTEEANNKCRTPLAKTCGSKYLYNGKCYTYTGTESSTSVSYTCDSGWTKETSTSGTYCCKGKSCYSSSRTDRCDSGYSSASVTGTYCWKYNGSTIADYHCDYGYAKWDSYNKTCWRCTVGNGYSAFTCNSGWNASTGACSLWSSAFTPTDSNQGSICSCGYYKTTSGTSSCSQGYTLSGSTCTRKYSVSGYSASSCVSAGGVFKQEINSAGVHTGLGNCEFTSTKSATTTSGTNAWIESGWTEGTTRWEWTYKSANTSYTTNYYCNSGYTKVNNSTCIKNNSATDPVCEGDTINGKCYKKL